MTKTRIWKRIVAITMAILLFLSITPISTYMDVRSNAATTDRIIYLNAGGSGLWDQAGAWFIAWVWGGGTTDAWYRGTSVGSGVYAFTIPSAATNIIFLRKNPSNTGLDWNGEWNRMETTITSSNNLYTIKSWSSGAWSQLTRKVTFSLSGVSKSSGNSSTLSGSQYSAKITANTGYVLPDTIKVAVGSTTLTSGTHYTYNKSTGAITIYGTSVTGDITITATGVAEAPTSYSITYALSGLTTNGAGSVDVGVQYTATLTASTGHTLPSAIEVKAGSTTLTAGNHYSYNPNTGAIIINASAITGNITITASGVKDTYGVEFDLTNATTNGAATCTYGTKYTATLTPASGYSLPAAITVSLGGTELTSGYTYNSSTGAISIDAAIVNGNIKITAVAIEDFYTLVGPSSIMGSNWDTRDPNNRMANTADGIFTYVFNELAAGTYEIKAVKNGEYSIGQWPQSGNYSFTTTAKGPVIVQLDLNNHTLTAYPINSMYVVAGTYDLCHSDWDPADTNNKMTLNSDGTLSITYIGISAGTNRFKVVAGGDWSVGNWPTDDYVIETTATSNITITFNPVTNEVKATVTVQEVKVEEYDRMDEIQLNPDNVFYVDADIVDYINDERVSAGIINGYGTVNQGIMNNAGDAPFSYLNYVISQQNYSYPLYFGPLNFYESRHGRVVNENTWYNLIGWGSAFNTVIANKDPNATADNPPALNTDAAVQGLVGSQLVNGTLADPVTGNPLLYFNKDAAETLKNGDKNVMAYYADLQFPFKQVYDPDTRVTTYSYDSASDYAVYYDYTNRQLYASNTHVLDTLLDADTSSTDYGFYPLNEPDDSGNELNHGFGMKFSIDFTVGEGGLLSNGQPVTFDFTGDDDVWVFIDGILILDMGGSHAKASGSIDFSTLTATVNDAYIVTPSDLLPSGDSFKVESYRDKDLMDWVFADSYQERASVDTSTITKSFAELGITDFNYSGVHTMTVFYVERAGIESNFSMEFTMVPVPSGLTLSKELNDKEINAGLLDPISGVADFDFEFTATSPNTTSVVFSNYSLTDKHTGMVTLVNPTGSSNGHAFSAAISGITNYTYAHSFLAANGDAAFIPGTSFAIKETTNGIFRYSSTKWSVYDAKNGYATVYSGSNASASFVMGEEDDNTAYSYAVVFTNNLELGALQISKIFNDAGLADTEFYIQVYLDLDGAGSTFEEALYTGLVYTIDGVAYTSTDGSIAIKGGQTATISGIPAGATYRLVEVTSDEDPWTMTGATNTSGTITYNGTQKATFTNTTKSNSMDKVIFVEAGTATPYSPAFNGQVITVTNLSSASSGLTATTNNGGITVTGAQANKVYTVTYTGRLPNGEIITGNITVYTFAATHKTYVFDFGLSSNLADTSHGHGLFQGGAFYNDNYTSTTATLTALTGNGNSQTTISATMNGTIGTAGTYSAVTFTPVAFMSQVESYTYTVRISVNGKTFDANDPETGVQLIGSITVMPANAVYYEDNFNVGGGNDPANKVIYSNNAPSTGPNLIQSNDQSGNYGYDDAYLGGYAQSAGSATTLSSGQYAYFTFYGTGFDLISRTNGSSAGFAVYIFTGEHTQEKLNFMNTFSGTMPADMVFVDTYYNNGDLHQVPVVSVRLGDYGQYTVYIQALATSPSLTSVSIDGVRIYDPLEDTSAYPNVAEQNTTVDELRVLYGIDNIVSLAGKGSGGVFMGMGKPDVVEDALENAAILENMDGKTIESAGDLESIYLHGPNNEMYLPKNFGIGFSYTVNSADWTLQLGAKAVTASSTAKSITIYAKSSNGKYTAVGTIELTTATDMYYDLTDMLADYSTVGRTYDIIIISNSDFANNEFVSLTTVKHAGITLV